MNGSAQPVWRKKTFVVDRLQLFLTTPGRTVASAHPGRKRVDVGFLNGCLANICVGINAMTPFIKPKTLQT